MSDTRNNEFTLVKTSMIALIVINLFTLLFSYSVGSSLGVNCSQAQYNNNPQCQVANIQSGIQATAASMTSSFTCLTSTNSTTNCWFKYPSVTTSTTCLFSGCPLTSVTNTVDVAAVAIVNFLTGIFTAIAYFIGLIAFVFYLVFFMLFELIPSIFAIPSLGPFATLFAIIYGFTVIVLSAYAIYIIINRVLHR